MCPLGVSSWDRIKEEKLDHTWVAVKVIEWNIQFLIGLLFSYYSWCLIIELFSVLILNYFSHILALACGERRIHIFHYTTCKAPYYLSVHVPTYRKWTTLKLWFFGTRDILFIFLAVDLVITSVGYLVYLIDTHHKSWLRLTWGFDNELSFNYLCGKTSWAFH